MTSWLSSETILLGDDAPLPLDAPFTLAGAARFGVGRHTLMSLWRRGLVRREGQGVYAVAQAPRTVEFRAAALALVVSPSAVVTDRTAAWLHGVDLQKRSQASLMPPITVFQRPGTRCRRPDVESGERALSAADVMVIGEVAVTTPLRTACDLGRRLYRFDALAALDAFLRIGVDHDRLLAEVPRFNRQRGVVQLRTLAPLADARAESVAEAWMRLFWIDTGLPSPELQHWVCDDHGRPLFRLDLALPELLYAAEYDGEAFHTEADDVTYDEDRRLWLRRERGWSLDVFTKADVFATGADPGARLLAGVIAARRRLGLTTSYPSLGGPARRT